MPFDPAFAGLTAKGITKLIETDIGDKCIHHAANVMTQDDRSEGDHQPQNQMSKKADSKKAHKHEDEGEWSRKSYWLSGRHQQQASSQPRLRPNEVLEDGWSRKTYWRRSRHQQQPASKVEAIHVPPERQMSKAARREEQFREQRRDKFQHAKDSYVPAASYSADESSWDEDKLHADVGRAVREASRRSGEEIRGGHW